MDSQAVEEFVQAANAPGTSLAEPALLLARVAYPQLDPSRWLAELEEMGRTARAHIEVGIGGAPPRRARVRAIAEFLFGQLGFVGNREQYDDPRNSLLNDVLSRRTGIPITLAVVFMEVAGRAGLDLEGVNFPGHFLLRCPPDPSDPAEEQPILLDPFHGGAVLSGSDCLRLLRGGADPDARVVHDRMLETADRRDILLRMLMNLKRAYLRVRSMPQARAVTELLVALDPGALTELRDRGLLASHLRDYASGLRDLETWLRLARIDEDNEEDRAARTQVWDHVKTLRRRLASMN